MIRNALVFTFFALMGLFLQSGVIHAAFPSAVAPDFILILVVDVALRFRTPWGVLGAFLLGLLADFGSGQYLGPNAGGMVAAFCLVGILANRVYAEKGLALMLIAFICSLCKSAVVVLLIYSHVQSVNLGREMIVTMLIEGALSGICAPVVLGLLRFSRRAVRARRKSTVKGARYGWSTQA